MRRLLAVLTVGTAVIASPVSVSVQSSPAAERLGKVHFETSCTPVAQKLFDRGMRYQHSFWYRSSKQTFEEALKADPNCAMAYWGIALGLLYNPHAPPPPADCRSTR